MDAQTIIARRTARELKPGMLVNKDQIDQDKPNAITPGRYFRVDEKGNYREVRFENGEERENWMFPWWVLGLLPAGALGYWWWRKRSRTRRALTRMAGT